jgi:hypothetical protein
MMICVPATNRRRANELMIQPPKPGKVQLRPWGRRKPFGGTEMWHRLYPETWSWLEANVTAKVWIKKRNGIWEFNFESDRDATLFKLRWGDGFGET